MILDRVGIRSRIAGGSLIIAILISIAAGIVINTQIERIVRAGTVAVLVSDAAPYVVALQTEPGESFDSPGLSQLVAVVDANGKVDLNTLPASLTGMLADIVRTSDTRIVSAGPAQYLVRAIPVDVSGETWHVVSARGAGPETTVLGQMRLLLIGGLALIAAGVAVSAWLLTSVSLGPVRRLRAKAETLTDSFSTELLPVGRSDDEIARLARTLNDLVTRLRESASRERQLVSDTSHELRTPLAILRTQLELARIESSSITQLVDDIRGAEKSAARLSALLGSLLELSSIEAAGSRANATAIELEREADAAAGRARYRAMRDEVDVHYHGQLSNEADQPNFPMTAEDFGRLLDNLLSNSLAAVQTVGTVTVQLDVDPQRLLLTVSDTGGGLPREFEAHALDRFSRSDDSRARGSGTGLGLAIVAAIVKNAHGTITLANDPGIGLSVAILVPSSGTDTDTGDLDVDLDLDEVDLRRRESP
ncbi:HAMP domain-containing sensor histidine kinase [Cryobacterium sp. CG_9.6]|uniref:HAMP domain-containing sensor histidine kinase n=1 Tax=Cryobacterium sp. CG_9.6 TaxID=2760710 RepID=UPI002473B082|nr:HAMP domain-containing sensor histidine kinase [Cryobacterium sp. CG_9.6]MDH6238527.1 signal transduction histidine kinase [Cryobacterium sp. CG_9.6]